MTAGDNGPPKNTTKTKLRIAGKETDREMLEPAGWSARNYLPNCGTGALTGHLIDTGMKRGE